MDHYKKKKVLSFGTPGTEKVILICLACLHCRCEHVSIESRDESKTAHTNKIKMKKRIYIKIRFAKTLLHSRSIIYS